MEGRIDRRDFLGAAASVAIGATLAKAGSATDLVTAEARGRPRPLRDVRFSQGVASGEPGTRGFTAWTKALGADRWGTMELEVARDPGFRRVVERRKVIARKRRDFAVQARVSGLEPNERYYYRFSADGRSSAVGRVKTLPPPDSREPIRIGVFSCQDYVAGHYTAHAGLAAEKDLDLVVCLGDYIYERQFYEPVRQDKTGRNRDGEVQTLREYRRKYALYHSDRNLRELRRRHPMLAIWDDHEVEDNYADELPGDATEDPRVAFTKRRRNAYRAFFEHMPFRPVTAPDGRGGRFRIYRSLRLGRNAELMLLDQRQYRDDQPCGDELPPVPPCSEEIRNDPARSFLGKPQRRWLKGRLRNSDAKWKLIGNQAMAMALDVPAGNPLNMDQWDGYGFERQDILGMVQERGIKNVSFLTGDIHTFFAGQVTPTGRKAQIGGPTPAATEFVTGSTTSLGIPETVAATTGAPLPPELVVILTDEGGLQSQNPHLAYSNAAERGYGVIEARRDRLDVSFRMPATTLEPKSPVSTLQRFRVDAGSYDVQQL